MRHLFPTTAVAVEPPAVSEPTDEPPAPAAVAVPDAPAGGQMAGTRAEVRRGRAVAGKGVVIVGQDGKTVKFRMKCAVCGRDYSSWKSIPIRHGTARAGFFCSKCRKRRDGEVHGYH